MLTRFTAPANPPLPFCCYLPFQPFSGSHTSNPISESDDGRLIPCTSHRAGTSSVICPRNVVIAVGPAFIVFADTMVACGSFSVVRLSQLRVGAACNEG